MDKSPKTFCYTNYTASVNKGLCNAYKLCHSGPKGQADNKKHNKTKLHHNRAHNKKANIEKTRKSPNRKKN